MNIKIKDIVFNPDVSFTKSNIPNLPYNKKIEAYVTENSLFTFDAKGRLNTLCTPEKELSIEVDNRIISFEEPYIIESFLSQTGYKVTHVEDSDDVCIQSLRELFIAKIGNKKYNLLANPTLNREEFKYLEDLGDKTYLYKVGNDLIKIVTYNRERVSTLAWGNFNAFNFSIGDIVDLKDLISDDRYKSMDNMQAIYSIEGKEVHIYFQQINKSKVHIHGLEIIF